MKESADVTVETSDQSFALNEGWGDNGTYKTKYSFGISAQFDHYQDLIRFNLDPPVDFDIRDYCAGMVFNGVSTISALNNYQNITSEKNWEFKI